MNTLQIASVTGRTGAAWPDRRYAVPFSDRLAMRAGLRLLLWANARAAGRPTFGGERRLHDREREAERRRDLLLPLH